MQEPLSSNRIRLLELLLVLGVAFAPAVLGSFNILFLGRPAYTPQEGIFRLLSSSSYELIGLAVLTYVLFRQSRTFHDIGLAFVWRDIPRSIALAIGGYAAFYASYLLIYYGFYAITRHALPQSNPGSLTIQFGSLIGTIAFLLVNPFFEELVVRAYTISEVKSLTGSGGLAIVVSVGVQVLYHLYQGFPAVIGSAALFLVFSLYFYGARRITPVILAHMYFDLMALFVYSR